MVAESIRQAFPDARSVSVDLQTIRFTDPRKGMRYTYLTPRIAQLGIIQFDQGIVPEPFDFTLRQGQVTASHAKYVPRDASPKQKEHLEEMRKKRGDLLRKSRLVEVHKGTGIPPDRIGGSPPPLAGIGLRRAFGLRSMRP
jgi:hypothetical protein